jgi:hypothetical protein
MSFGKIILTAAIGLAYCNTLQAGISPYKYRTMKVTVLDNDTKEPVPNAKVQVTYKDMHFFYQPKSDSAVTDSDGVASVQVAEGTRDWTLTAKAKNAEFCVWPGNFPDEMATSKEETIYVGRFHESKITVIVPNGYVGPVKIELPIQPDLNLKPHPDQDFQFRANSEGYVDIDPTTYQVSYWDLLNTVTYHCFRAEYEDGRLISSETVDGVGDTAVAMRYVTGSYSDQSKRGRQLYVIGTKKECDDLIKKVSKREPTLLVVPSAWLEMKKLIVYENCPKGKVFDAYFSGSASRTKAK